MNGSQSKCQSVSTLDLRWISCMIALVAGSVFASTARAEDNCDSYAKLTLQQVKQNLDRRCKYSGARWSQDARRHRDWCRDVGPVEWRSELKLRETMLKQCKG